PASRSARLMAKVSVSRSLIGRRMGSVRRQAVAGSANGLDGASIERTVDLVTHVFHVHIDDVRPALVGEVPDVFDEPRSGENLTGMTHEELEQRKFLGRELDRLIAATDGARGRIQGEIGDPQNGRSLTSSPADKGSEPGGQLGERARLGEGVVGDHVQTSDTIIAGTRRRRYG